MSTMADSSYGFVSTSCSVDCVGREALGEVPVRRRRVGARGDRRARPAGWPAARRARRRRRSRRSRRRTASVTDAAASTRRALVRRHRRRLLDGLARAGEQRDPGRPAARRRRWRRRPRRRPLLAGGRDAGAEPGARQRRRRTAPPASTARRRVANDGRRRGSSPRDRPRRWRRPGDVTASIGMRRTITATVRRPAVGARARCVVVARRRSRSSTQPPKPVRSGVGQRGARLGVEVDQRLVAGPARSAGASARRAGWPRPARATHSSALHDEPRVRRRRLDVARARPGRPPRRRRRSPRRTPAAAATSAPPTVSAPRVVERRGRGDDAGAATSAVARGPRRRRRSTGVAAGRVDGRRARRGRRSTRLGQRRRRASAVVGMTARVLEADEVGRAERADEVELAAERVDQPAGHGQRLRRRRVGAVDDRHDDVADRRTARAAGRRAACASVAISSTAARSAPSAGLVGDRPAVAEVGGAVVDDRHRHAVAEVVGRERDQPGIAEVQHAVVADRRPPAAATTPTGVDEAGAAGRTRRRR